MDTKLAGHRSADAGEGADLRETFFVRDMDNMGVGADGLAERQELPGGGKLGGERSAVGMGADPVPPRRPCLCCAGTDDLLIFVVQAKGKIAANKFFQEVKRQRFVYAGGIAPGYSRMRRS
ncbi:hypothetical protein [Sinorhizobium medicae]